MTAANIEAVDGGHVGTDLGNALRRLAAAAGDLVAAKASRQVDEWTDRLNDFTDSAGPAERAGIEGIKASVTGKNPLWAAAKGAWLGASGPVKVAVVVSLVLLVVLAPVVLLLLLLALLVAGVVAGVRAASR